jgi:hypothetical protein
MIMKETYTLSNGVEIPKLGLGTWFIPDENAAQAVKDAAEIGYRHIDTAQAYSNESGVGEGIRACGVKREDMFVTTKLAAEVKSYKEAVVSIDTSLKTMGLDYLDLMIIHSPAARDLFVQLPISITVKNYSNNEKIFYPPKKLNTTDTPQADARAGTLAYYAPWGDVVMFYGSFGAAAGLYELGYAVSGSEYIREMAGTIRIEERLLP